jgi:hypothetical protein
MAQVTFVAGSKGALGACNIRDVLNRMIASYSAQHMVDKAATISPLSDTLHNVIWWIRPRCYQTGTT